MHIVILSGGVGSRLWPLSRKAHPKPFIKLPCGKSILQNTFFRALHLDPEGIINVTSNEFVFKIKEELSALSTTLEPTYILEPFGRNTAAAIAMASLWVDSNELILVMPSDHLIENEEAFANAVASAKALAEQNRIVTFGIKPNGPETGYGYIEFEGNAVKNFVEKPSQEKAIEYIASGNYLWNSGMFCFKAGVMLEEMKKHCPDILAQSQICFESSKAQKTTSLKLDSATFAHVRDDSIDYAVMEKSDKVSIVPCDIGWSDIGNWNALAKISAQDENGNVASARAILSKTSNCYIESQNRIIATIGIKDLVIVDTPDALLIANKDNVQDVKNIYNRLAKVGHHTHETHVTVYRPWGSYTVLEDGENFKIKRIEVTPGASLSLQSHKHRSEHWVVVSGQALVVNGDNKLVLGISQSTYIPTGNKHRLSNPSDTAMLVIIEVQTGGYLGEDDICRYEDVYRDTAAPKHFRLA